MLLLPGSLPPDRATLKALCLGLQVPANIAARLSDASIEPFSGSWSDAEREMLGLPDDLCDGQSLAAIFPQTTGLASTHAVASPLHATLGLTDLTPLDPALISLSIQESRLLCEAADQHLSGEGVRLKFIAANSWLVTCANKMSVLTERPDWLIGEPLRSNLPRGRDARLVERWMNELQMLLHAHPVNIAREERRLPPVNLVWLWGFGPLDPNKNTEVVAAALPRPALPMTEVGRGRAAPTEYLPHLAHLQALRSGDVPAWKNAWQAVSAEILSAPTIILGDSRPRLRMTVATPSITSRLLSHFKRKATLAEVLSKLQQSR